MFRPAKRHFDPNGYVRMSAGYLWYWLKKDEDFQKNRSRSRLIWAEDGGRIFYCCPNCRKVIQSYCPIDGNSESVINGRELDTIRCECCSSCLSHHWLTFENAVSRKTAGAIRLRSKICPFCKKSNTSFWSGVESGICSVSTFAISLMTCGNCIRRWRTDSFEMKA